MTFPMNIYDTDCIINNIHECPHIIAKPYVEDGCYINQCIRDNDLSDKFVVNSMNRLKGTFKEYCFDKNVFVLRGCNAKTHISNNAFTSTTTNVHVARGFGEFIYHIHIPANTKFRAIKLNTNSDYGNEKEILFDCGMNLTPLNSDLVDKIVDKELQNHYKRQDNKIVWKQNQQIQILFFQLEPMKGGRKVYILNRLRNIIKKGRSNYIIYKKQYLSLSEARKLDS